MRRPPAFPDAEACIVRSEVASRSQLDEDRWNMMRLGREWWLPLLVVVSGLTLSLAAFTYLERLDQRAARLDFEGRARDQLALLDHTLGRARDAVTVIADLLHAQPEISRGEYEQFSQLVLDRQPIFSSLGYSRWTAPEEVDGVVAQLRADGYPVSGVMIRTDPNLPYQPAPPTAEHRLILTRMAPAVVGRDVIGFDVTSPADRREAVLQARDSGQPRMTRSLRLGGRPIDEAAVLLFVPVYHGGSIPLSVEERRARFAGTASIGLLIEPMFRQIMAEQNDVSVRTVVVDRTEDPAGVVLFDRLAPGQARLTTDLQALTAHPLAVWHTLEMGARTWDVLSTPTLAFEVQAGSVAPELALILGIAITLLAAGLTLLGVRHAYALQRHLDEREATTTALTQANEALEAANLEMEELVSAVSHDLRNPLQSITVASDLLRVGVDRSDLSAVRLATDGLRRATDTMMRIVNDLLDHSRSGWAPLLHEPVDLASLAQELAYERAETLKAAGARLDIGVLPTIRGDPGRLTAALDNLISNALKHGRRGGGMQIALGSRVAEGEVHVFVADNGAGVPEQHRKRIFKLFQRLGTESDGTGLGLAIVERVARAHGGRVWAEETPGGGATFVMAFPIETASFEAARSPIDQEGAEGQRAQR
jgi:signal transduction histidine kinase